MRYQIQLTANVRAKQYFRGKMLAIMDIGAASGVSLQLFGAGGEQGVEDFGEVGKNFGVYSPEASFTGAEFLSTVNTTVEIIVSNSRVEVIDGANLLVTISPASLPLEVKPEPAAAMSNPAAVTVTAAATALVAANAARKAVRFFNQDLVNEAALGGAGITWATRCLVIGPGDTHLETDAANLAWFGICNTGLTANIGIQEVTV